MQTHRQNYKLRPASSGRSEVRILFAFDPKRQAIMLLAGDKASGKSSKLKWTGWYRTAIPLAEKRYKDHLKALEVQHDQHE